MAVALALALTTATAEARGFGGGFHSGVIGPRVGTWGRPLQPVRPGYGWSGGQPSFADRDPHFHHRRHGGSWGYGLGGLALGLGGQFGAYGYPDFYDDDVYSPPVAAAPADVQIEVPVEIEVASDLPAAIAACARRFKTYDPATRTYVGKGYVRRSFP